MADLLLKTVDNVLNNLYPLRIDRSLFLDLRGAIESKSTDPTLISLIALGIQVDMRILAPPKLQYGGGNRPGDSVVMPREGVWLFEGQKFYLPANVNGFCLLVVGRRRFQVLQFISKLSRYFNDFGMGILECPDRVEAVQVVADVEPAFTKMKHEAEAARKECELIIAKELKKMELTELAKRPSFGTAGRRIHLLANHFEIKISGGTLTQYHIEITHSRMKLTRDENRVCFWRVIKDNPTIFPTPFAVAFDGSRQCFSLNRLKFPNENATFKFQFEMQLNREDKPSQVAVLFLNVGPVVLDLRTVHTAALTDRSMIPIQAIDVILRQGRSNSAFTIKPKSGIRSATACTRFQTDSVFTSAHVVQGYKPIVNMDVSHSAFVKPVNVVDYLIDILNAVSDGGYTRKQMHAGVELSDIERKVFETEIKGLRIRVTHRPGSVREFRVNSVPGSAVSLYFEVDERKSVAEYFVERYGPLQFPKFPVLHVGSKRRTAYIPVEHCCLAENQKVTKKLTERQTSTMIKQAACDAPMRMRKIQSLSCDAKFWRRKPTWRSVVMPRESVWRFEGQKFYVPANVNGFGLLVVGRRKDDPIVLQFISKLSKCCNDFGMRMPEWPDRVEAVQVVADVDPTITKMKHEADVAEKECELIVAILPQKSTQFYSEVKRVGEVQLGLITQVVLMKSVMDVISP